MRKTFLAFFIILTMLSTNLWAVNITGSMKSSTGNNLKNAQLDYNRIDGTKDSYTVEIGQDGKYSIALEPGLWKLMFRSVGNVDYVCNVFISKTQKDFSLDVSLMPIILLDFTSLVVAGDFNEFDFYSGKVLEQNADGTYSVEVEYDGDSLSYIVCANLPNSAMQFLPGTQSMGYTYEEELGFLAKLPLVNKKVKISFDPKKYSKVNTKPSFTCTDSEISKMLSSSETLQVLQDKSNTELQRLYMNGEMDSMRIEFNAVFSKVKSMFEAETSLFLKLSYLQFYSDYATIANDLGFSDLIDNKFLNKASMSIPANSEYWSSFDYIPVMIAFISGDGQKSKLISGILKSNPDANLKAKILYDITERLFYSENQKEGKKYLDKLIKEYPNSRYTRKAKSVFSEEKVIDIGKSLPYFKLTNLENPSVEITPESLKGKYVLVDFWATWCGPCVGEMENLHKAYEEYKSKNFMIFSISFDRKESDISKFRKGKFKMPWLHSFAKGTWDSDVAYDYGVTGIPMPLLVDPSGQIIALEEELRGEMLANTLRRLVK